jgi:hypothetical protein
MLSEVYQIFHASIGCNHVINKFHSPKKQVKNEVQKENKGKMIKKKGKASKKKVGIENQDKENAQIAFHIQRPNPESGSTFSPIKELQASENPFLLNSNVNMIQGDFKSPFKSSINNRPEFVDSNDNTLVINVLKL